MKYVAFLLILISAACFKDETLRGYGGADKVWTLTELDGAPFGATATLTFPEEGAIAGRGPCNSYRATMTVPYPWFEAGPVMSTKMACPDLQREAQFFEALSAMSLSEVLGDVMILSTPDGREMVFKAGG